LRADARTKTGRCFRDDERGVALVEFVLVLPLLLVTLFAMLDFGRVFNYWIDATHLANEGARFAAVNNNPNTSGTLQAYIQQQGDTDELRNGGTASVPDPLEVCIAFTGSGGNAVGQPVTVTATVTYNWLPFLSSDWSADFFGHKLPLASEVTGSSTMRLEAVGTNYLAECS
jgi:Flp pilus assembly protein TadG